MDDRALVYRGADRPDMSVINPESDVWQHIKVRVATLPTDSVNKHFRFHSIIWQQIGLFDIPPSAVMAG